MLCMPPERSEVSEVNILLLFVLSLVLDVQFHVHSVGSKHVLSSGT